MSGRAEADPTTLDLSPGECMERTRKGVLNVLVGVAVVVAITGLLLRGRREPLLASVPERLEETMSLALILIFVFSALLRRALSRPGLAAGSNGCRRFYWGHVGPALVGAAAAPLGLVHGWLILPRLEAVLPYWVVSMALGIMAYPRAYELERLEPRRTASGGKGR
jgi:hypothetical protein